jgi:hypothetical protein
MAAVEELQEQLLALEELNWREEALARREVKAKISVTSQNFHFGL